MRGTPRIIILVSCFESVLVALSGKNPLGGLALQPLFVAGPLDDALFGEPCFPLCVSDWPAEVEPE